jgi:dTDP-4-amino-4,6-dideoxygalactose transaminase
MNIPLVDLKRQYQSIKSEIDKSIAKIIDNTAFIKGQAVTDFENAFAKALGAKHCMAVANGTDALVICLKILGVKNGDEVIVPANSFIATSEAAGVVGAQAVFADCLPDTYNIDITKLETAITSKTKVIIPVHLYGQPADMEAVMKIAKKHNLFVIEDSAQAHLADFKMSDGTRKTVGTIGNMATFSFYPGKNLGAYGDAGAIVTNNDNLAKKARMYANHGRIAKYNHEFEGINSRMDGIQGAVLGVKLKYLPEWTEKRREVAAYYTKALSEVNEIKLPVVDNRANPAWHLYVIRTEKRDELLRFLKERGIGAGIHYPIALPNLNAYQHLNYQREDFPTASKYEEQILSLPMFPELTYIELNYITDSIKEFFNK